MKFCRKISVLCSFLLVFSLLLTSCGTQEADGEGLSGNVNGTPKYIFLFIGDGFSFPQAAALGIYNGTVENNFVGTLDEPTTDNIPEAIFPSFTEFPVLGAVTTYDASKFVTDSASAATAIASGVKTLDGMIGMDPYGNPVPSIAEQLKKEAGYKVGVITSVSLDHATPGGFYAHVPSRSNYYDIAVDLVNSDFDYFGGGGFKKPTGSDGDQPHIYELAEAAGYTIVDTYEGFEALDGDSDKVIAVNQVLDWEGDMALNYGIDRDDDDLKLADYVAKGIEVLGEEEPFFMMVEGGKIDWAGHANDGYTLIQDVKELESAVNEAIAFAEKHPDETLILVTGDHETGGFTMGFNGTEYDTYFYLLSGQKMSGEKFVREYVNGYRENQVPFETAMEDVTEMFGLIMPDDPLAETTPHPALVLTDREIEILKEGYEKTMIPYDEREDADTLEYKTIWSMYDYEPFQLTITHVLNNKAGLGWTSTAHTGLPAAIYAKGCGQDIFAGYYDNTDIAPKIKSLVGIK